jgi:hypothetical protein
MFFFSAKDPLKYLMVYISPYFLYRLVARQIEPDLLNNT